MSPHVIPIKPPFSPEMLREVCERIRLKESRGDLLEYGAGHSTAWFDRNGWKVTTVESDPTWADHIRYMVSGAEVLYHPNKKPLTLNKKFDLVYVDGVDEHRPYYIESLGVTVKVGGAAVVDDCHWDSLRPSIERIIGTGWFEREWTVGGMHVRKTGERKYHETTLLRRIS